MMTSEINRKDEKGWVSQFFVSLNTRRRIVLYGNVMDLIPDMDKDYRTSPPVPLAQWLIRKLTDGGYRRIITYDCDREPEIEHWDDLSREDGRKQFWHRKDTKPTVQKPTIHYQSPSSVFNQINIMLVDVSSPSAAIIINPDLRLRYPSQEAVSMQRMTENAAEAVLQSEAGETRLQNISIIIYGRETFIPDEFIKLDPQTDLIFIPYPDKARREWFFKLFYDNFYKETEKNPDPEELAHITEGYRMSELTQLIGLSQQEKIGIDQFKELLLLYQFGRKEDRWLQIKPRDAIEYFTTRYNIRGQDEVLAEVQDALFRAKHRISQLIDTTGKKPPLVLFFVGSTGVGKTLTARAIAEFVTGSKQNLKIIDMSEYQQSHSIQRLIGSPPSFVGYSEGGQLTTFIKEKPFSIILMDEVEKGHERILDLFLQILDGARLTDGKGETHDLSQTGLIFTSNIGTEEINEATELEKEKYRAVSDYFIDKVKEFFSEDLNRPELYNRLKRGIVVFNFIKKDVALQVIHDKLHSLAGEANERLKEKQLEATISYNEDDRKDKEAAESLLKQIEFDKYGLRDVDTELERKFGTALAKFLEDPPRSGTFRFTWHVGEDSYLQGAIKSTESIS